MRRDRGPGAGAGIAGAALPPTWRGGTTTILCNGNVVGQAEENIAMRFMGRKTSGVQLSNHIDWEAPKEAMT